MIRIQGKSRQGGPVLEVGHGPGARNLELPPFDRNHMVLVTGTKLPGAYKGDASLIQSSTVNLVAGQHSGERSLLVA
jgi:hypothetical protein